MIRSLLLAALLVGTVQCASNYYKIYYRALNNLGSLLSGQGNFDRLRYRYYKPILDVGAQLPDASRIQLFSKKLITQPGPKPLAYVASKYYLYPHRVSAHWDYWIDLDFSSEAFSLPGLQLPSGYRIYTQSTDRLPEFKPYPDVRSGYPHWRNTGIFLFWIMLVIFTGHLILRLAEFLPTTLGYLFYFSLAFLLGFAALGMALWGLAMSTGTFTLPVMWIAWLGLITVLFRGKRKDIPGFNLGGPLPGVAAQPVNGWFLFLLLAVIVFILAGNNTQVITTYDAMDHWIMKAKVMFYEQTLLTNYTSLNEYPLLWTIHVAGQFLLSHSFLSDEFAQWMNSLFFLSILGQLYGGGLLCGLSRNQAVISLLIFIGVFYQPYPFELNIPENAIIAFITSFALLLVLGMKSARHQGFLGLLLLTAAGLSLIKYEGSIMVFCCLAAAAIGYGRDLPSRLGRNGPGLLGGVLLLPIIWSYWARNFCPSADVPYHFTTMFNWEKLKLIGLVTQHIFMRPGWHWVTAGACLYVIFLRVIERKNIDVFLMAYLAAVLLFSFIAFLGWPADQIPRGFYEANLRLRYHAVTLVMLLFMRSFKQLQIILKK